MILYRKLFLGLIIDAVLMGSAYVYFWKVKGDYYFPARYEIAFSAMSYITILCISILIIITIHHNFVTKGK
jgi:hypothetical protein